jgi:hypothetical protein
VLNAPDSKAKRSDYVSFLARKAKCYFELSNIEAAEEQLDQASGHFAHLTFEKISEDAYLYEAVSYFMQIDIDLARLAADTGRAGAISRFKPLCQAADSQIAACPWLPATLFAA